MRKSTMSPDQLAARELIATRLLAVGWKPTDWHREFDRGKESIMEAELTRRTKKMDLRVFYEASRNLVDLKVENRAGEGAELVFFCMDKLEPLLEAIIGFQDEVDSRNFRTYFTKLVKICPETYVVRDTELIKLFADDDPERPSQRGKR